MSSPHETPGAPSPLRAPHRQRAVFVDRDGTLNVDLRYMRDPARLELYRGVPRALRLLHQHGFQVVVVTNQSGIVRGLYTDEDVAAIHARLQERLAQHGTGVDAFYYCPHAPEDGCVCRKPNPGLFQRAASDLGLDLGSSAIIGDRLLDVQAGQRLGLLTAYVPEPGERMRYPEEVPLARASADICAPTFFEAALRVMARG